MARKASAKAIDARINAIYSQTCSGIQINILDIGKVFAVGKQAIERGEDDAQLAATLLAYVNTIRQN